MFTKILSKTRYIIPVCTAGLFVVLLVALMPIRVHVDTTPTVSLQAVHAGLWGPGDKLVLCGNAPVVTETATEVCYTYGGENGQCSFCDIMRLAQNILNFLIFAGVLIAALLFVNAGILYLGASANPGNVSRAHKIFVNTVIGLLVILAAWLLIDVAMKTLYGENGKWGPWNEIICKGEITEPVCIQKREGLDPLPGGPDPTDPDPCMTDCEARNATHDACVANSGSHCAGDPACIVSTCGTRDDCAAVCAGGPVDPGPATCDNLPALAAKFGAKYPSGNDPALTAMISCYRGIANIEMYIDKGQIFTYELSNPKCNYTNGNPVCGKCAHSVNSCHYGRGSGKGAQAVDFNVIASGSEAELCRRVKAAQGTCGGVVLCESNHTHISLSTCGGG